MERAAGSTNNYVGLGGGEGGGGGGGGLCLEEVESSMNVSQLNSIAFGSCVSLSSPRFPYRSFRVRRLGQCGYDERLPDGRLPLRSQSDHQRLPLHRPDVHHTQVGQTQRGQSYHTS